MDKVLEYKEKISAKLERYDKIVELEKQTGVDKFYIFCVGALLAGILLFVVGGEELVVGLVGFIYPAYMSFKAINTPGTGDDTQWLTYWIAFLVWTYHPSTKGSNLIYNTLIKPYVAPHVGQIDSALKHGEDAAKKMAAKIEEKSQ
ncbi:TB2/DP1/HVA22-related protein [Phytophthora cactorum]|nr:TB2/DP1/HVA22-related protein [Phytophthora cactorum]